MNNYVKVLKFLLDERERLLALKVIAEETKNDEDYEVLKILLRMQNDTFMAVYELAKGLGTQYARKDK